MQLLGAILVIVGLVLVVFAAIQAVLGVLGDSIVIAGVFAAAGALALIPGIPLLLSVGRE